MGRRRHNLQVAACLCGLEASTHAMKRQGQQACAFCKDPKGESKYQSSVATAAASLENLNKAKRRVQHGRDSTGRLGTAATDGANVRFQRSCTSCFLPSAYTVLL
jgi:hypothetical protein